MPKIESSGKKSSLRKCRFLLNANISRSLSSPLGNSINFDVLHTSDISNHVLSDEEIVKIAKRQKRIIITHDHDYGECETPWRCLR